jgi:hypothetical protein
MPDWLPGFRELLASLLIGTVLGSVMVLSSRQEKASPPELTLMVRSAPACVSPVGYVGAVSYQEKIGCYTYEEAVFHFQPRVRTVRFGDSPRAVPRREPAGPYYRKYVPLAKGQSPNSVLLARSQSPLPVSAKKSGGRYVCAKKSDSGQKSDQNKRAHIDRQCCLDPDEVPNPHCSY